MFNHFSVCLSVWLLVGLGTGVLGESQSSSVDQSTKGKVNINPFKNKIKNLFKDSATAICQNCNGIASISVIVSGSSTPSWTLQGQCGCSAGQQAAVDAEYCTETNPTSPVCQAIQSLPASFHLTVNILTCCQPVSTPTPTPVPTPEPTTTLPSLADSGHVGVSISVYCPNGVCYP